jgi:predicted transcriptional regulator
MSGRISFTLNLNPAVVEAFQAAAQAENKSADQVIEDLMQRYVAEQDDYDYYGAENEPLSEEAYDAYFKQKVEEGRRSIENGDWVSDEDVRAEFAQLVADMAKTK